MLKVIFTLAFIFLLLVGVCEVFYFLGTLIFKPKIKPRKYLILRLNNNCAEQQILSELFNLRWFGERFANKIIFLTDQLMPDEADRLEREFKSENVEFKSGVFNGRE